MSLLSSLWRPFYRSLPNEATELPISFLRKNLAAIHAQNALAAFPGIPAVFGWNYTNSVTLGEASPGTAPNPARIYLTYGSGVNAIKIKIDMTYSGGKCTKAAHYYSSDNGTSYVPMTDERGNHVLNISYSGADITSFTWAKT